MFVVLLLLLAFPQLSLMLLNRSAHAANPLVGFRVDRSRIVHVGMGCSARNASSPSATARCGRPMHAAAWCASRPTASQRFIGQRASERFAALAADGGAAMEAKYTQGTLPTAWPSPPRRPSDRNFAPTCSK